MSDESAFLRAIQADPRDSTSRLVYADWLEERGDPRGELVRIEEEMRTLPVFGDRFWELKPRRNELRAQCSPEWLGAMGFGTTCHPTFRHGWPDGIKERWRVIREFVERWHGKPMPDVGGRLEEIRDVEARLGRDLPPSLRDWVAFEHDATTEGRSAIRDYPKIEWTCDRSALTLFELREGPMEVGIRLEYFDRDDPPVSYYMDAPEEGDEPIADRLTTFALAYFINNTSGRGGSSAEVEDLAPVLRELEAWFPHRCRIEETTLYSWFGEMRLFEDENILVKIASRHLWNQPDRTYMDTKVGDSMPDERLPQCLCGSLRDGYWVFGHFQRRRGQR